MSHLYTSATYSYTSVLYDYDLCSIISIWLNDLIALYINYESIKSVAEEDGKIR